MQANTINGFIPAQEYWNVLDVTIPTGRSSIKYSSDNINLYFPISSTYSQ